MLKITDVRTVLLTGPLTGDPYILELRQRRSAAFIEIHTDCEHTGIAETYAGYFCPEMVPAIVDFFRPILIGQTPDDVPELWRRMYHCGNFWCRVGLGASVLGGIEAALWDLKGKSDGVPVYRLLGGGGCATKLPAYATGGPSNYPESKLASKIDYYLSLGFTALKIAAGRLDANGFTVDSDPWKAADFEGAKLRFVRSHAGSDLGLMLDAHMGNSHSVTWTLETALAVARAAEPYGLIFLEEPLPYTDVTCYSSLCERTETPIAGGECLTALCEWQTFADGACFDLGQPDASFLSGLSQFLNVAQLMKRDGRQIATHAWGAGGSLMQNIHCAFAAPNTRILEVPPNFGPLHTEIVEGSFAMENGFVLRPESPGLGIKLTDATKNRYPFVPGSGEFNSVPGKVLVG